VKVKQVELTGFKSFADRTLLPLHNGITCIVGPNGCGKSNIVDAFRWVLGEQSAKSLRGEKMEEVIFQGSAAKKQKGMAEITLVLSYEGSPSSASVFSSETAAAKIHVPAGLPLQVLGRGLKQGTAEGSENNGNNNREGSASDEIIVSRRLYRSGESEYLINKKQCRLKDIRDIFLDTGLDVKSYSILDQVKIGEIINTKPSDRRFLIEEVAGVMKYKARKAEALSKLESSKQNLQRISDIVYEVRRQINTLDRQVKKAEKYKKLIGELKDVELRIAKCKYMELTSILSSLQADIERLGEADSAKKSEISTLENIIDTIRLGIADNEKALSELENTLHGKEKSISDTEKHTAVLKNSIENIKADISRLLHQQEESYTKKAELTKKISDLDDTERSLYINMEGISGELSEKKGLIADIEITIGNTDAELEQKRKELFRLSEDLSSKKNEFHKMQSSYETLKYRESVSLNDMESIKGGITALQKATAEAEGLITGKTSELSEMKAEKNSIIGEIAILKDSIEDKKTALSREREELASNISRLNSLQELIVDSSLPDFLQRSGNESSGFMLLSDAINTKKGFETAIESALSEKINSLIIDNLKDALHAAQVIKEKNIARTAILYTEAKSHEQENDEELALINHSGIIGRASDFVTFENGNAEAMQEPLIQETMQKPIIQPIIQKVQRILRNIYIVKDLQTAADLLFSGVLSGQSKSTAVYLITQDGEAINSDGWILAGHGKDILKRKREIKELQKIVDEQQAKIKNMEKALQSAYDELSDRKESLRNVEESVIDIEKQISLADQSLQNRQDELERKNRRLSFLETELTTISQEKEQFEAIIKSKSKEIDEVQAERNIIDEDITKLQQTLALYRKEYEEAKSHLTDMKLAIASYREKIEALKKEKNSIIKNIAELQTQKELAAKEVQSAEKKIKESISELHIMENNIKTLIIEADRVRQERAALKETINAETLDVASKGSSLKNLRSDMDIILQQLSSANSKAVERRLRIENIENGIMQKYGLNIKNELTEEQKIGRKDETNVEANIEASIEEFPDYSEDEDKINALNEKIRELGPVNLGTIEEYEELKTRYDFLTKQQRDLSMSIAELEEAINRVNTTTKRRLREAFESLRAKFSEVFTAIFGGGRADIVLTDEENILESGIEITAQLPGKKLQNLNLLSSGEKALTSLALLFAGFMIKPSPLCVLDEVDAPLDESNTVRFAQMIKGLSKDTQFIVITHNRTTMEVADYLYGITMEEPGASKVISLQFSDIAA
jgi:chromosome segregation protein